MDRTKTGNLNLRITEGERWDFKAWCAQHEFTLIEAFRKGQTMFQFITERFPGLGPEHVETILDGVESIMIDESQEIRVERRSEGWAVTVNGDHVSTRDLEVIEEPSPFRRDEDFIGMTQFPLIEALELSARLSNEGPSQADDFDVE